MVNSNNALNKHFKRHFEGEYSIRKKIFIICYLTVISLIILFAAALLGEQRMASITIGPIVIDGVTGILTAINSAIAFVIIMIDYKVGLWFSEVILGISFLIMLIGFVFTSNKSAVPGMINDFLTMICVFFISYQFKIMEKDIMYDEITGLLSRSGFKRLSKDSIEKKKLHHIMLVQISNFREINDNLGHEYGDIVLKQIGQRMSDGISGNGFVARLDGTQFALAIYNEVEINQFAEKILSCITQRVQVKKNEDLVNCYLDAMIGYATYPIDSDNINELIQYADIAMYHSTTRNTERIRAFNGSMEEELKREARIHANIKSSLENNFFYMVYQPQYSTVNKKLRGFEALIRCKLPTGEMINPGEFIAVAEKTDFILSIDDYVLRHTMKEFSNILNINPDIILSVNVSAKNISSPFFVEKIKNTIEETGFNPKNLEIEITEYSFADSREQTIYNIKKLKTMGAHIALDDFGTGYTSLEQLLNLDVDLLKIDKSLVDEIGNPANTVGRDFIEAVIYMGHLKQSEVIAEGVEDEKQLSVLKEYECDMIQGYIWGKPMSFVDAKELVGRECISENDSAFDEKTGKVAEFIDEINEASTVAV